MTGFGLGDLRLLLRAVGDLELIVDDVDPTRVLECIRMCASPNKEIVPFLGCSEFLGQK